MTPIHVAEKPSYSPAKRWIAQQIARLFTQAPRWSIQRPLGFLRKAASAASLNASFFHAASDDGLRLHCLRVPSAVPDSRKLPVAFIHGYAETKERHFRVAALLSRAGHDVLMVDLRAHGGSQGSETTFGVKERHNVTSLIDEAWRRGWLPRGKVITMGLSLGGATVLQHAPLDPRVDRVVAVAPFASAPAAIESYRHKYFPFLTKRFGELAFELESARTGWRFEDSSSLDAMARIQVPVLLLVGSRDTNLGLEGHARPLANANQAGRCELHIVDGPNHFNILTRRWPGLDEKLVEFCGK